MLQNDDKPFKILTDLCIIRIGRCFQVFIRNLGGYEMSENKGAGKNQEGRLRIVLGNTDRTAEEVITHIRRHTNEFSGLKLEKAADVPQRVGQVVVDVKLPEEEIDTARLRHTLNEAGSCVFQVESIKKI